MNRVEHLKTTILCALRSDAHADIREAAAHLGPDTPRRAKIAQDILAKAKKDLSNKVRVERNYIRNGVLCHGVFWVLPSKVQKGDVVTGNAHLLDDAASAPKKPETSKKTAKAKPEPAPKKKTAEESVKHGAAMMAKLKQKHAKGPVGKQSGQTQDAPPKKQEPMKPKTKSAEVKQTKQEPKQKSVPEAEIFKNEIWGAPEDLMKKVYDGADLDYSNNLSESRIAFRAAVSLASIAKDEPYYKDAVGAILVQHAKSRFGNIAFRKSEAKYGKYANAFYNLDLEVVAATALMWNNSVQDRTAITKVSQGETNASPQRILMSETLVKMIDESEPQTKSLYRGVHIPKSSLAEMLKTGRTDELAGIVTTTSDLQKAAAHALQTTQDEIPVIVEYPEAMKHHALEMMQGDVLISGRSEYGVKSITKDADGTYHVTLKVAASTKTPEASAEIYEELGLPVPEHIKKTDNPTTSSKPDSADTVLTDEQFHKVLKDVCGIQSVKHISKYSTNRSTLCKGAEHVYRNYGYDGAVQFLTMYAQIAWKEDYWSIKFEDTKSGYDSALVAMMRDDWVDSQYAQMRDMEKKELDENSSGADVYFKIGAQALNAVIENDGVEQPVALYRGMKTWRKGMEQYVNAQKGDTVSLGAASSFSEQRGVANNFASYDGVVLEILQSAKVKCMYIEGLNESEYLVPDGDFEVVNRAQSKKRTVLTLKPVEKRS